LTHPTGPLGTSAHPSVNYSIDGPAHRLLMEPFPRRVRGLIGETVVVDTREAQLLYESNLPPRLYVPVDHLAHDLLEATEHSTHCPFKGDASYWSIAVGGETRENKIWHYPEPVEQAPWLEGLAGFYWDAVDRWLDEDEESPGHLRDPYHRLDVIESGEPYTASIEGKPVAHSDRPTILSETGQPNRHLFRPDEVTAALEPSHTVTLDPYKGEGRHFNVNGVDDAAATYSLLGEGIVFS
jgi:uncharacterized protein (DUF427 family)